MKAPNASDMNRMRTQPIVAPRTMRRQSARGITSLPTGKMVPIAAFPILREDTVKSGRLRFNFEHMETAEVLMNAINVRVMAYFVPMLAFDRFNGSMDQLNLSYEGKPPLDGEAVVPYIQLRAMEAGGGANWAVHRYLGLHYPAGAMYNTGYMEAYNQIWNFRAKNRSPDLALRHVADATLAPAFWAHDKFRHMVPDFDQAIIDGEVPLNVVSDTRLPIKGLRYTATDPGVTSYSTVTGLSGGTSAPVGAPRNAVVDVVNGAVPQVFAQMAESGLSVSLSNIEMARKTQAFAELQERLALLDCDVGNICGNRDGAAHATIGAGASAGGVQTVRQADPKAHGAAMAGAADQVYVLVEGFRLFRAGHRHSLPVPAPFTTSVAP